MRWSRTSAAIVVACCLTVVLPITARANEDSAKPAPRAAIQIGDASIVLIAANSQLFAFVDRTEDNAPLPGAAINIDLPDGTSLPMVQATEGLFAAPFNRAGRMHDAFMVSLRSPEATGNAPAEIAYDDVPDHAPAGGAVALATKLWIAVVSAGIGAFSSALFMLWLRGSRKRASARVVGTTQAA